MNFSNPIWFTVTSQPLPPGWLDWNVGQVGAATSATYSNGVFSLTGAGYGAVGQTSDTLHFAYQPLSGDGTIVARVTTLSGASSGLGLMIRESLAADARLAITHAWSYSGSLYLTSSSRLDPAAYSYYQGLGIHPIPYWIKLVRIGSSFTSYVSPDGVNWGSGTNQTVSMAQNVYIGLAMWSGSTTSSASATFDHVSVSSASSPSPIITGISATTGSVGSQIMITGNNFGAFQSDSFVTLNGTPVSTITWSDTAILVQIPSGATSGSLVVLTAPNMDESNPVTFTVTSQPLPTAWLDQDIGNIGLVGSGTFSGTTFTVSGAGYGSDGVTADLNHYVYRSLSGDGTIVARLTSLTGTSSLGGITIREALDAGAKQVSLVGIKSGSSAYLKALWRTSVDSYPSSQPIGTVPIPCWLKIVRSGNNFTMSYSANGVYWDPAQSYSQTVTLAQNAYIGIVVNSGSSSAIETATFDNVSISSTGAPAPAITSVSNTTGAIGGQILITGTDFGAVQGSSVVTLNGTPVTINTWNNTGILFTVPSGAASGLLAVSVAPTMNSSNPVMFTVTSQPLLTGWQDLDIGAVGVAGSGTYSGGTFSVSGAGYGPLNNPTDSLHFVYRTLSGDGVIIARVTGVSDGVSIEGGVMIRESLDPGAKQAYAGVYGSSRLTKMVAGRTTTSAYSTYQYTTDSSLPEWVKLVRSSTIFTAYFSSDGVNWDSGTSQTISMGQNVYVGLASNSGNTSATGAVTFDNVSITGGLHPLISSISPTSGPLGTSVTVQGASFGDTQGTSTLTFNGAQATSIASWSNTQIVADVPSAATTGPVAVTVGGIGSNANLTFDVYHPVIDSLSPPAAAANAVVILDGHGFGTYPSANDHVYFNGVQASIANWSDTSIMAYVPSTCTSGAVTVTRGGITSDGVTFTKLANPPTITNLSPVQGVLGAWPVTITGTGFGAVQSNSTVKFWGAPPVSAQVISWSDTAIDVMVPDSAVSGPITVRVGGFDAQGPWFYVQSIAQVTDSLSNVSTYTSMMVSGQWAAQASSGPGCSTCSIRGNEQNALDSNGNLSLLTDALGHTTSYAYDSHNNITAVSQPLDGSTTATTSYTYNDKGEVLTTTDPLGHVTSNTYDTHGNLTSVTTPAPNGSTAASVTQFVYDSHGQLTSITDPLNHVTSIAYTSAGLINTITDAQSHVTTYGYDARGNRTSVTDALNHTTTFVYDIMGRLTGITYPDSGTVSFTYDSRGRAPR